MAVLPAGRGLYINAHQVTTTGPHTAWKIETEGSAGGEIRRTLSRRFGVPVFLHRGVAYAVEPLPAEQATAVVYGVENQPDLHRFLLREGLVRAALAAGFEAWIGFGGEISCADSDNPLLAEGPVRVEPVLNLRVAREGALEDLTLLIARRNVRWRFAESLADPIFAAVAAGESVIRLRGDGPPRGRVAALQDGQIQLARADGRTTERPADEYALTANAALVYRVLRQSGAERAEAVVRRAWQASSARLPNGRPNEYAIQERELGALGMLERIGWALELPDGSRAEIDRQPIEVKVRSR